MLEEMKHQLMKEMQERVKEETEGIKDEGRDTYDLGERRDEIGKSILSLTIGSAKSSGHRRSAAAHQRKIYGICESCEGEIHLGR